MQTLKVRQASKIMGISDEFLRKLIKAGMIPGAICMEHEGRFSYLIARAPFLQWLGVKDEQ